MVDLAVGTQSNGQGHETAFAQFLFERSRHPVREDPLRPGRQRPHRHGRRHRRLALGDHAGQLDPQPRRRRGDRRFRPLAEEELEVAGADLVFEDGAFRIAGTDRSGRT